MTEDGDGVETEQGDAQKTKPNGRERAIKVCATQMDVLGLWATVEG